MLELYEYIARGCDRCPYCSDDGSCNSRDMARDCMRAMEQPTAEVQE